MGEPRTVGVEEEFLLVDPETRAVSPRASEVIKGHEEHGHHRVPHVASDELDKELFQHQLETRTDPSADLADVGCQIRAARRTAGEAAEASGLAVMVSGVVPMTLDAPEVSPNDRYRDMVQTFGEAARKGSTCGTHVHVEIASAEEGVGVIDRISPWLPVLVAVGANSPFADGRDTRYASWRSRAWANWPSAGPTEAFGSLAAYHEVSRQLMVTGAARDEGMLYYDARLSRSQPTVEVRVLDACTDPDDVVLAAALVRGLVETAAAEWAAGGPLPGWRSEVLRGAHWRAARMGLTNTLVHPVERVLAPARDVLAALVDHVRDRLEAAGDLPLVEEGIERVLAAGGATRQRAAYERTGSIEGVVDDLVRRTRESWSGTPAHP